MSAFWDAVASIIMIAIVLAVGGIVLIAGLRHFGNSILSLGWVLFELAKGRWERRAMKKSSPDLTADQIS